MRIFKTNVLKKTETEIINSKKSNFKINCFTIVLNAIIKIYAFFQNKKDIHNTMGN